MDRSSTLNSIKSKKIINSSSSINASMTIQDTIPQITSTSNVERSKVDITQEYLKYTAHLHILNDYVSISITLYIVDISISVYSFANC